MRVMAKVRIGWNQEVGRCSIQLAQLSNQRAVRAPRRRAAPRSGPPRSRRTFPAAAGRLSRFALGTSCAGPTGLEATAARCICSCSGTTTRRFVLAVRRDCTRHARHTRLMREGAATVAIFREPQRRVQVDKRELIHYSEVDDVRTARRRRHMPPPLMLLPQEALIEVDDDLDAEELGSEGAQGAAGDAAAARAILGAEFREGEYQVQVHMLELRDLIAADAGGTSDPVVQVAVFGQTRHSKVRPTWAWHGAPCLSCPLPGAPANAVLRHR